MDNPKTLTKIAYNYIDDVIEKLRLVFQELQTKNPTAANDALTRMNSLIQAKSLQPSDPQVQNRLQDASRFLQDSKKTLPFVNPETQKAVQNTTNNSGRASWERFTVKKDPKYAITEVPGANGEPGVIVIPMLSMQGTNPAIQRIQQQMGDWMSFHETGEGKNKGFTWETHVRGTKEAWKKFKSLAPMWLDDPAVLEGTVNERRLPSETQVRPEEVRQPRTLKVSLINFGTPDSIQDWEAKGKKLEYNRKGIRIVFEPDDDMFFTAVQFANRDLQLQNRTNYHQYSIDIYELNPDKLVQFSKQLQGWKYGVIELNKAIATATGKSVGIIQEKRTSMEKSKPLSATVINNGINKNMDVPPLPPRDQFGAELEQRYPNAFNRSIASEGQIEAQKDGAYFALGRQASVLADEPGFGKTVQAQMAADMATAQGQKVLVLTPSILIAENWTNNKQGPVRFLGHTPEMIRAIQSPDEFDAAVADPQVRWIVIPYSSFANRNDEFTLADKIKKAANAKVFGALLMDEFQQIKSLQSDTFRAISKAVDAAGIQHRIGMTGTPADNDPSDLYTQLMLLRHPLLWGQDGNSKTGQGKQWSLRQTEKGFANQFLGGETVDDDNAGPMAKINGVFAWANRLSPQEQQAILQLFATTYIRREKADVKPDLPPKNREATPVGTPEEAAYWQSEQNKMLEEMAKNKSSTYSTFLKKMALSKAKYTIARAIDYLQKNPTEKLFIITKHPDVATTIETALNQQLGDGIAAAVIGGSDGEKQIKRQIVPETFKAENGVLPNKQMPLRCAIYTMRLGSVGLNFGNAGLALFNDMDWNPSTNLQAEDRVHRITNTRPANIEYTYLQGTYEEQQWNRVQKKQALNRVTMDIMRQAHSMPPEQLNKLATDFVLNIVDSLLMKIPMTPQEEQFVNRKKQEFVAKQQSQQMAPAQPIPVAASCWYRNFKTATSKHRHLW